jgi:tRNA-dihydrouridine synthase A
MRDSGVAIAPMVDITTRHFRFLMRLLTKRTVLWTPMFYARRIASRKAHQVSCMLRFHELEGPPVAQLGGDDPKMMVAAARRIQSLGYSEVNVNLGCPAHNAKSERFGASLMLPAAHNTVVAAVRAMTSELQIPVSVKVRIGVDAHDSYHFFRDFVARLHQEGGCDRFVIHARKALLNGLPDGVSAPQPSSRGAVTTKQNRLAAIVPLRYEYVHRLKAELPHLRIEINGGIRSIADVHAATAGGLLDGVMLGRLARDDPWFFASVDSALFGERDAFEGLAPLEARLRVIEQYADYCEGEQKDGHETWDGRDPNPRT